MLYYFAEEVGKASDGAIELGAHNQVQARASSLLLDIWRIAMIADVYIGMENRTVRISTSLPDLGEA